MRGWSYAAGAPNLGWMYFLTLEELQVLYALTMLWRQDEDPEIGAADNFDLIWRLGLRKITDMGYTFHAGMVLDGDLEVWVEDSSSVPQDWKSVKGFFDHLILCTVDKTVPWPNYESALRTSAAFLARELPHAHDLFERVREELAKIADIALEARLRGPEIRAELEGELKRIVH